MKVPLNTLLRFTRFHLAGMNDIDDERDPNIQYHKPQPVYQEYKKPVESKRKMRKRKGKK